MNVVYHLDTQGLKNQRTCLKKKKRKGRFSATGLDMVYSLDGKVPHRSQYAHRSCHQLYNDFMNSDGLI